MTTPYDAFRGVHPQLALGAQLAGSLLAFVILGYWADRLLNTSPWLLLTGVILGMAAVFVRLALLVRQG